MVELIQKADIGITAKDIASNVQFNNKIDISKHTKEQEGLSHLFQFCNLIFPEKPEELFKMFQKEIFKWNFLKNLKPELNYSKDSIFPSRFEREFANIKKIGEGLDSEVYSATNIIDGCQYAVKKITFDYNLKIDENIFQEANIMATINHPNVVRYYAPWVEFDLSNSRASVDYKNNAEASDYLTYIVQPNKNSNIRISFFIQMELCSSCNFASLCNSLDTISILEKVEQLAEGLSHIHKLGIIHRDIKPSNFLIGLDGQPKIADFGISIKENSINEDAMEYATDMYASPEHYEIDKISEKSDIYSFGLTIFDLLISFKTNMEHIKSIIALKNKREFPERFVEKYSHFNGLCEIILKMIDPVPEKRPTADEVVTAIKEIIERYK